MIRRINKHGNDLKDIIKSCPSGVIDDIYAIEYYIQGNNVVINASFTQVGNELVVVLPTSQLELLPNGILMRRAYYKVLDASYPDGYYNLQFEDNMNIWLGDVESEEPVIPDYVTEEELSSTLSSYATQSWVYGMGYATESYVSGQIGSVKNWVVSQSFLTSASLSNYITESTIESLGFATESWVQGQGYLTEHQDLSSYATQNWVQSQGYITIGEIPSGLATQSWVESYTYDKSTIGQIGEKAVGDALYEAQEWVESYTYDKSTIEAFAGKARVDALSDAQLWVSSQQFATQSWVQSQGYLTSHQDLSSYATQSWVQSQGYLTSHQDLSSYATQSWVLNKGYMSYNDMASYATKAWVSSQQFATQSWVQGQGYYTSSSTIPASIIGDNLESRVHDIEIGATEIPGYVTNEVIGSYATKAWVSSNYLADSKVWCGTREQWDRLTSEEKATYKIALVTA